jgi:hypothetical protein
MMASFRRNLAIFSGDNIFYFMQKSHYFLHLAAGETPQGFSGRCADRTEARAQRAADPGLTVSPGLVTVPLDFSYSEAVRTLSDPLARAARPDFLTGRYVRDADQVAEEQLPPLEAKERFLLYDAENGEFVELRDGGARVLAALQQHGTLGSLIEAQRRGGASEAALDRLEQFAAELHRLGVLRSTTPQPTPSPALASAQG